MMGRKKILLASLALAASYLPVGSALAIPMLMEQWETGEFNIGSTSLDATRVAHGASQTNSQTDTASVHLAGFDTSLGDLTGVELFFKTGWTLNAQVTAIDTYGNFGWDTSQGTADSKINLLVDLVTPDGGIKTRQRKESESCSKTRLFASHTGCSDSDYRSGSFNGSLGLGALSLADFTGGGLTFQLSRKISVTASSTDADSKVTAASTYNQWKGSVSAHYTYEKRAEVPEPASLALLGAGLVAFRFRRRTQKVRNA